MRWVFEVNTAVRLHMTMFWNFHDFSGFFQISMKIDRRSYDDFSWIIDQSLVGCVTNKRMHNGIHNPKHIIGSHISEFLEVIVHSRRPCFILLAILSYLKCRTTTIATVHLKLCWVKLMRTTCVQSDPNPSV